MTTVPLKSLCQIKHGGTPSKNNSAYWQGEIPWVSPKDMKLTLLFDAADHITDEAIEKSATSLVPIKSILVVVRSGILAHTLPVAQVGRPVAFNQDIKALIPDSEKIDPDYLFWFIRSQQSRVLSQGVKKGATVHSLQSGFIENLQVPLPARTEQRRIFELLSRAEGIVRLRRDAQQKAAELVPAIFLEMFGDPVLNPKGWSIVPLSQVADVQGGLQVTTKRAPLPLEAPYLRVANVYRSRLELREIKSIRLTTAELQRTRLEVGDLLFVEGHGNPQEVGRCAVWDGSIDGCTHQNHLIRARPDQTKLLPEFACASLNSVSGRRTLVDTGKTTSGLSTISAQNVKQAKLMLPPLSWQVLFKQRADDAVSIATQQTAATAKAELVFNALLAQAFK